ncbi:sensor histidine kinase [Flavobacterium ajazii]|uniref:sensor histidine kinase n=1 Tax=Flavobacterium ajazii TaxID=2692318 RepID=UPI0013CF8B6C|nr:histidine kinase [Flavobacterium ajazii]
MKKRFYLHALISSPILAIYGISPLYIFNIYSVKYFFFTLLGATINNLIFWIINIVLILYLQNSKKWFVCLLSYLITLSVIPLRTYLLNIFKLTSVFDLLDVYYLYPAVSSIAINTIILMICNSIIMSQKKKSIEFKLEHLKVEQLEAQKQVLIQQLQPHFLFNSLSVLKSLIKVDNEKAENYAIKLSDFLRYSVESHKTNTVTVDEELKFTKDFVTLQKVRFEDAFIFQCDLPDEILQKKIPVLALQTLVENAIKHNYFTEKRPLLIKVAYDNDCISVSNNKASIKVTERTSTGLSNLNRRYEIITGKPIEILDTENSFCVTLPLIS